MSADCGRQGFFDSPPTAAVKPALPPAVFCLDIWFAFLYLVGAPPLRDIDRQPELSLLPSEESVYPNMCIIIVPLLERPRTS